MLQFYTGDELGNIKSIRCSLNTNSTWTCESTTEQNDSIVSSSTRDKGVQKLALFTNDTYQLLYAARVDGSLSAFTFENDNHLKLTQEWNDNRFRNDHSFIGLETSSDSIYWCTSQGALGRVPVESVPSEKSLHKAHLPLRLLDWRLSPSFDAFAYGGEEVELSVWNLERTFLPQETETAQPGGKRKRNELLPAEIWRARNVSNDSLNLRQPVCITSLLYLRGISVNHDHLLAATQSGNLRRYDIRAGRRPVADWKLNCLQWPNMLSQGLNENEVFVADNVKGLVAMDLRNGKTLYSFKKLSGAVTSVASCPDNILAFTSQDRFFRVHRTATAERGVLYEGRPDEGGLLYMKTIPTVIAYNPRSALARDVQFNEDEELWSRLPVVGELESTVN